MSLREPKNSKLMIAGGGTGGHVLAGIAVAEAWRAHLGSNAPVTFVGASGGLEEKLVPRAGYPLQLLTLGTLNRVGVARQFKTLLQLPLALLKSFFILFKDRPSVVLGVGGYASGPLVLMAWFFRPFGVHTAIIEQNSVAGFTNRILGRLVRSVFCAFPGEHPGLPGQKVVVTGNPIRSTFKKLPPAALDPFTVFIFGGSQGALGINTLVLEALPFLKDLQARIRFVHQTGERDYERVVGGYQSAGISARVEKFIHDMAGAYSEASVLVCRAGSSTLAEIAAVGRASILIPFPFASDNHQEVNARVYSDAGAAQILIQGRSKGEDLARMIRSLMSGDEIGKMEKKVLEFYRPNAAEDIVKVLIE